jgi:YVTN family beta-propeller protein
MQKFCFAALICAVLLGRAQADDSYKFIKKIPIGGDDGWDYLSIDPAAHRLYVTHGTKIDVIDLETNTPAGEIAGTSGVHGFAIAAELERGFASNGGEGKVSVVGLKTLKTITKVGTGENPDAIVYDSPTNEVYAFNGRSHSATVIDGKANKPIATIPLPGKPEFAAVDTKAGRIFVNIEDKSEVVAIDAATHAVVATWPLAPGEEPSGMAFDEAHHRLFIGCDNKMMVMVDSDTGKIIGSVPIGENVDACSFDPGTQLAFASCGDGTVTIAKEESPQKLVVVQTLQTEKFARTMTLDPLTHRIYVSTADMKPAPSPAPSPAPRRRSPMHGTFRVLVYGSQR